MDSSPSHRCLLASHDVHSILSAVGRSSANRVLSHFTASQSFHTTGAKETDTPIAVHTSHSGESWAPIHITPKNAIQGVAKNVKPVSRTAAPTPAQVRCQLRTNSNSHRMNSVAKLLTAVPYRPRSSEPTTTQVQDQRQRAHDATQQAKAGPVQFERNQAIYGQGPS